MGEILSGHNEKALHQEKSRVREQALRWERSRRGDHPGKALSSLSSRGAGSSEQGGWRRGIPGSPWSGQLSQPAAPGTNAGEEPAGSSPAGEDLSTAGSQAENESTKSRCGIKRKTYQDLQLAASPLARVM